ncbi:MAG: monovalent cation/H(+) antiporter subunit G [bacterium]|nr:monovalent cation/H(+) antiporter subunit G [bacterium]
MIIIGIVIIVIGLFFDFCGSLGIVRLPDVYNRLQAATKGVTLGTCGILIGICFMSHQSVFVIKCLLCCILLMLTSPISTHALVRAAHIAGIKLWDKSVVDKYEEDKPKPE